MQATDQASFGGCFYKRHFKSAHAVVTIPSTLRRHKFLISSSFCKRRYMHELKLKLSSMEAANSSKCQDNQNGLPAVTASTSTHSTSGLPV
jgi:hypothetical protein